MIEWVFILAAVVGAQVCLDRLADIWTQQDDSDFEREISKLRGDDR